MAPRFVACCVCFNISSLWILAFTVIFWNRELNAAIARNDKVTMKLWGQLVSTSDKLTVDLQKEKEAAEVFTKAETQSILIQAQREIAEAKLAQGGVLAKVASEVEALSSILHRQIEGNLSIGLAETKAELRLLREQITSHVLLHEVVSSGGASPLERLRLLEHYAFMKWGMPSVSSLHCDFDCNHRGLSGVIKRIVPTCQCLCAGGWSGLKCDVPPPRWKQPKVEMSYPVVIDTIPMSEVTLPARKDTVIECRNASLDYYLSKYKTTEYRSDAALKFFFFLCQNSLSPVCSSQEKRVILFDIGANVGQLLPFWIREFLNYTHCRTNRTIVFAVEPNPYNIAILHHNVKQKNTYFHSGNVQVIESAVSYFNGEAELNYSPVQNIGAQGNERGTLGTNYEKNASYFKVPVLTVDEIMQQYGFFEEPVVIPLLKIDAEGFDAAVLYGAQRTLGLTQVVVFECHKLWKDVGYRLRDAVEYLAKLEFETFKMGQHYWIRMTAPDYWDDAFDDTLTWSNCIAVRKGNPFASMFPRPPPCTTTD